ncbi:MAG: MraY family glycosyltransferase [Minisyncoccota bacterium]
MRIDLFLPPFLVAFSLTIGLILLFLLTPLFQRSIWRVGERHIKKHRLSRLGGTAILLSFIFTMLFDAHLVMTRELYGLLLGGFFILVFGLWDDISELGWRVQIFFQTALSALVFLFGTRITMFSNPFGGVWVLPYNEWVIPGFLIILCWLFLVMNAMNWLDGIDGLCGGVSLITLVTIFLLSLKPEVSQPPIAILAMIGIGTSLGFLVFNMYPARILAGTTGSMFLGFLIAVLAIIAGTKIATALLVLALPITDAVFVIWQRMRDGVPVAQADRRHLHYKLLERGWSERHITQFLLAITGIIAIIALSVQGPNKFFALIFVFASVFALLLYVNQQTVPSGVGTMRKH